tara:strand:- start:663 stop:800 length:138 start_codon:yes stop_codon:yes gene_type:complete
MQLVLKQVRGFEELLDDPMNSLLLIKEKEPKAQAFMMPSVASLPV